MTSKALKKAKRRIKNGLSRGLTTTQSHIKRRKRHRHLIPRPGRSCGECFECCWVLQIVEWHKPEYEPCAHLRNGRCGCYEDRPPVCEKFLCAWRQGLFPQAFRPDKCGIIVHGDNKDIQGRSPCVLVASAMNLEELYGNPAYRLIDDAYQAAGSHIALAVPPEERGDRAA